MSAVLESIFVPVFKWLNSMESAIDNLRVVRAKNFSPLHFLKPFSVLGPYWTACIANIVFCFCMYSILYISKNWDGFIKSFKDLVKWW